MRRIGLILITLGFLLAAWVAIQDQIQINWAWFVPTALVAVAGVFLVQRASRAAAVHAETVAANIEDIDRSLHAIVQKVTQLNREKEMINTYDIRHKIDEMLLDDLNTFVEARETIGTRYGIHAYAEIMNHFAAGERYLNRVWSCSADGYIDEVNAYIGHAKDQFNETLELFEGLRGSDPA